jgi:hypothetical protein
MTHSTAIASAIDTRLAEARTEIDMLEQALTSLLADDRGAPAEPTHERPARSTRKPTPRTRPSRPRGDRPVPTGNVEELLQGAADGLSAAALAEASGTDYRQLLDRLRELEAVGTIRRTGTRRSSRWRWITDEERITERAAELEQRAAPSGV